MGQVVMNTYDADVYIPEFKGLMQYGDQMGNDLRYSPDCYNVETPAGVLQPALKLGEITLRNNNGELINYNKNCSVMYLRAKNYETQPLSGKSWLKIGNSETSLTYIVSSNAEYDCLLFSIENKLYQSILPTGSGFNGNELEYMTGLAIYELSGTFSGKHWSWCTYEEVISGTVWPEGMDSVPSAAVPGGNINIIVLANETDGTYIFGGNGLFSKITSTPANFCNVARFAERIWGCGVGDDKDSIFYSRAYSATNWTQDNDDPANGGGQIREPTFDKDKLVAIVPFGDALIAFSERRAWRITGSDPSNFNIQEQYGNGTRYPRSIAVMGDKIIMLGEHGLVAYDGYKVYPFMKEATYEMFRLQQTGKPEDFAPVGIVTGDKYILSLGNKLGYSSTSHDVTNSGFRFLVYDGMDGTINMVDSPLVTDMCIMSPEAWAMIALPSTGTGVYAKVGLSLVQFDSWDRKQPVSNGVKWVTPWVTFGRKDIQKGGFEVYFTPELADNAASGVTFKFSVQTEEKTKTKTYTVVPLSSEEVIAGKKYKQKRLHFGGNGRRFRLIIEVEAGNTIPWRLIGGIHIIAEMDKD